MIDPRSPPSWQLTAAQFTILRDDPWFVADTRARVSELEPALRHRVGDAQALDAFYRLWLADRAVFPGLETNRIDVTRASWRGSGGVHARFD